MSSILDSALEEYLGAAGAGRYVEALDAMQTLLRLRAAALFTKAGIKLKPAPVVEVTRAEWMAPLLFEVDTDVWMADQAWAIVEDGGLQAPTEIWAAALTMGSLVTFRQHTEGQPGEDTNSAGNVARHALAGVELGRVFQLSEMVLSGHLDELATRMVGKEIHRETIRRRNLAAAPWHRPGFAMLAAVMNMAGVEKPTAALNRQVMAEMKRLGLLPNTKVAHKGEKEPVRDRALADAVKAKPDLWNEIRCAVTDFMAGRQTGLTPEMRTLCAEALERARASGDPLVG